MVPRHNQVSVFPVCINMGDSGQEWEAIVLLFQTFYKQFFRAIGQFFDLIPV